MSNYGFSGSVKEDYAVLVKEEQHPSENSAKEEGTRFSHLATLDSVAKSCVGEFYVSNIILKFDLRPSIQSKLF
jgi:hypothetical protein